MNARVLQRLRTPLPDQHITGAAWPLVVGWFLESEALQRYAAGRQHSKLERALRDRFERRIEGPADIREFHERVYESLNWSRLTACLIEVWHDQRT
jgi:hypothetical protein